MTSTNFKKQADASGIQPDSLFNEEISHELNELNELNSLNSFNSWLISLVEESGYSFGATSRSLISHLPFTRSR